jgi:retinol dehydrogenase 12
MLGGSPIKFDPRVDIPDLTGKVILVTGGNVGLGKQSILEFAHHKPAQIWLAARNPQKAQAAIDDIKKQVPDAPLKFLELDLASFASIRKAAATFLAESGRLDILMLNAGIMACPPGQTKEGYEIQFGTNHMGHALLTKLLIPVLDKTAKMVQPDGGDVRVVVLSSRGHTWSVNGAIDFDSLKTDGAKYGAYSLYGQSKTSNVLFARQLAKEYPQLKVAAVHPGVVKTNLMTGSTGGPWIIRLLQPIGYHFLTSLEDGAKNQLWASVSKELKSGEYYEPVGWEGRASSYATDDELAKKMWDWTEKELEGAGTA